MMRTLKVISSLAIKAAYVELVPQFEKASGCKVATEWAGMVDILKRMKAGETLDLVIGSAAVVDELMQLGRIVPGSRVDLAKSGVGVAVRSGARKPDIGSVEALKRALRAAKSIGYSSGPSGVYLSGLFERLGIAAELKPKITQTPPGVFVGERVARGEIEIGFQQVPELLPVAGIDYVGPLPREIQAITVFSGGIHSGADEPEAARAWLKFLTSPGAAPVIRKKGMEPG
jgi:molybdate transport system substrate-binding protein